MASISISVGELFDVAKEFKVLPDNIKNMYAEKNDIVTEIDLGRFIPDLKMKVSFEAFEEGNVIFIIQSPVVLKLPSKFLKTNIYEDIVFVKKGKLIINLNRAIRKKTDKVIIKDIDFSNEMFTIKI